MLGMVVLPPRLPYQPIDTGIKPGGPRKCRPISSRRRRIKLSRVPCSPSRRKPGPVVTCRERSTNSRDISGPRCAGVCRVVNLDYRANQGHG